MISDVWERAKGFIQYRWGNWSSDGVKMYFFSQGQMSYNNYNISLKLSYTYSYRVFFPMLSLLLLSLTMKITCVRKSSYVSVTLLGSQNILLICKMNSWGNEASLTLLLVYSMYHQRNKSTGKLCSSQLQYVMHI